MEASTQQGNAISLSQKYSFLILGGLGYIGRNLLKYILDNDLASRVRIVDKSLPALSYWFEPFLSLLENPIVETKQADLSREPSVKKAFTTDDGQNFEIVINLAGETKYGMNEDVYREKCFEVTKLCADEALRAGAKRFIEISTGQVYKPGSKPSQEEGKLKPWTSIAKFRQQAEEYLPKCEGLEFVILRPAFVYGVCDFSSLTPRLVCAAVYKHLNEKMKFLWDKKLGINCVHVEDLAAAIIHSIENVQSGETFNVVDNSNLNQGGFNEIIQEIFEIKTDFVGKFLSLATRVSLTSFTEAANENHMKPWLTLCENHSIRRSPLTPFIDKELLLDNSLYMDGTKLSATGFSLKHPTISTQLVRDQLDYFIANKIYPDIFSEQAAGSEETN